MNKNLAFVFPGQGSQKVGMLQALIAEHASAKNLFTEASAILNYDLLEMVQNGPEEKLNQTLHTQPALLVAGLAVWTVWLEKGGAMPTVLAGHSLGEYTALVASGALDFRDAVALVAKRAAAMQDAVPEGKGAMAAIIGLTVDQVAKICQQVAEDDVVAPANLNGPGQTVIAGDTNAVERAMEAAKAAGARKVVKLAVSAPSHCLLMQPAADEMAKVLEDIEIKAPNIPVINNVDVEVESFGNAIKLALIRQLCYPVRWVETIEKIAGMDVEIIAECGPGKVLTGMNKRIEPSLQLVALSDPAAFSELLEKEAM